MSMGKLILVGLLVSRWLEVLIKPIFFTGILAVRIKEIKPSDRKSCLKYGGIENMEFPMEFPRVC